MTAPRHAFAAAVWWSDLPTSQRIVALAFADEARGNDDVSFCSWARLMKRTGMSRTAVINAMRALTAAGWLELVEPPTSRRAARYRLVRGTRRAPLEVHDVHPTGARAAPLGRQEGSTSRTPEVHEAHPRGARRVPEQGFQQGEEEPDVLQQQRDVDFAENNMHTPTPPDPDFADELRDTYRVPWTDHDVNAALRRITHVLGGDAAAAGHARGALRGLAQRKTRITNLGGLMHKMSDQEIRDEMRVQEPTTDWVTSDPRFAGLIDDARTHPHHPNCNGSGWAGETDDGRTIPCLGCKPHLSSAAS